MAARDASYMAFSGLCFGEEFLNLPLRDCLAMSKRAGKPHGARVSSSLPGARWPLDQRSI
jgi:hypothetical protein